MSLPKLSEQLGGVRAPDRCQACSAMFVELDRWREHDQADKPTATVVVLCRPCGKRLIEPHPRLYAKMDPREPHPGTMELCQLCRHRDGVACPLAKCHGGEPPGVAIGPPPDRVHILARPARLSGWHETYRSYPKTCDRREVLAMVGSFPSEVANGT